MITSRSRASVVAVACALLTVSSAAQVPPLATVFQQERSDKEDIVLCRNGDVHKGEVQNADFTVNTPYGAVKLPLRRCAGVSFEGSRTNTEALVTTNYNRITGIIADGSITIKIGTDGQKIDVRKEKVRYVLMRKAEDETTGMVADGRTDLFVMANGDLLTGLPVSPRILIAMGQAEVFVAIAEMRKIEMLGTENVTALVTMANGDIMRGSVMTEDLSLKLDAGGEVDSVYMNKFATVLVGDGNAQVAALFGVAQLVLGENDGALVQSDVSSGGEVITDSIGMKLKLIPAGSFMMGSDKSIEKNERPVHKVTLTKPFYIGVTEVTQSQYEGVMGSNLSKFKGPNLPAENVSWNDAQEFCKRLSDKEKAKYRLPTEAEWEYACRAGSLTEYYWGDRFDEKYAFCNPYSNNRPQPVALLEPNKWGLYDMSGNAWEWCQDWYGAYGSADQIDPKGPSLGSSRVLRGGSWYGNYSRCRSADRYYNAPESQFVYHIYGFRVVRTPE